MNHAELAQTQGSSGQHACCCFSQSGTSPDVASRKPCKRDTASCARSPGIEAAWQSLSLKADLTCWSITAQGTNSACLIKHQSAEPPGSTRLARLAHMLMFCQTVARQAHMIFTLSMFCEASGCWADRPHSSCKTSAHALCWHAGHLPSSQTLLHLGLNWWHAV